MAPKTTAKGRPKGRRQKRKAKSCPPVRDVPPPVPEEGFESHAFTWMGVSPVTATGQGAEGGGGEGSDLPSDDDADAAKSSTEEAIVLLGPSSPVPLRPLGPSDVLFGRGPDIYRHEGNRRYRALVVERKDEYARSRKLEKSGVAMGVVRTVTECWGGAFVRRLEDGQGGVEGICEVTMAALDAYDVAMGERASRNRWVDVGEKIAREKTLQALRAQKFQVFTDVANLPPGRAEHSPELPEKAAAREAATDEMKCGKCRGILVAATACAPCGCAHCAGCIPEPQQQCPTCTAVVASTISLPCLDRIVSSCVRGELADFALEELEAYERRWKEILQEKEVELG
mmetsp:Transcript_35421/g.105779  ORF Transcript_35421/g.105779 Transcript_35421/m.105779 type:complete len:342 (-) Transcript_35421:192-1217(-)